MVLPPRQAVTLLYLLAWIAYHVLIWPGSNSHEYAQRLPLLVLPALLVVAGSSVAIYTKALHLPPRIQGALAESSSLRAAAVFTLTVLAGATIMLLDLLFTYGL